ncbi:MAG: 50S ribosomal protein L11 methyltransferase [Lachnospiraceae bacterium]|nr:50S ribosomal protein L11 methyltransferase [Lachnospiraceae bacterium]
MLICMKYNKYTISTIISAEDILSAELAALGIEGVEISDSNLPEDDGVPVFIDDLPDNPLSDGEAYLSFYLDADSDNSAVIAAVKDLLSELKRSMDIGAGTLTSDTTEDKDWLNNWKEYFHQFVLDFEDGKRALFIPSWEKRDTDTSGYDYVINIDPGTAFGTGAHETTSMCIKLLHKYVRAGDVITDIGTGSGILSILALKFGAARAAGTDIDPNAEAAVYKNLEDNDIAPGLFEYITGDILSDPGLRAHLEKKADVLCANILPAVLVPLFPHAQGLLKNGGIMIVSGVIDTKAGLIRQELSGNNFKIVEETAQGEWMAFAARLEA